MYNIVKIGSLRLLDFWQFQQPALQLKSKFKKFDVLDV